MPGPVNVGFLVCPPESLLDGFVHRPGELDPSLVRAVSSHLSRCTPCREEADRRRRELEAVIVKRPWLWALAAMTGLAAAATVFLWHEPATPSTQAALRFTMSFTGRESDARPDPRIAALARFDPPGDAAQLVERVGAGVAAPPLSAEDRRELTAARARLDSGVWVDAARLLEDLAARHPARPGLRLLLGYAFARAGEFEKARLQYALADELGAGVEACLGLANASLRLGDVPVARRELAEHVLSRRPDDDEARDLLDRINASYQRRSR